MAEPHPLVRQLRFTRSEFVRGVKGVNEEDARARVEPMNCISWNVGHLAWQEQRYFLTLAQGTTPLPDIETRFASGGPASTPSMAEVLGAWRRITTEVDPWLDTVTTETLLAHPIRQGKPISRSLGNLLQRVIYHYWYHTGENLAIRQQLGHRRLPQFVGNIDEEAPYQPER
ncbi:MAG: DinB family protein [Chloroflexi bacterium]|nr:MAG: DinB family protein [Chloroflexota bacterium]